MWAAIGIYRKLDLEEEDDELHEASNPDLCQDWPQPDPTGRRNPDLPTLSLAPKEACSMYRTHGSGGRSIHGFKIGSIVYIQYLHAGARYMRKQTTRDT